MADIIINIGNVEDGANVVPVAGATETQSTPKSTQEGGASEKGNDNLLLKGLTVWNKAKPWINKVISHEVNMVELRTGRREYAQKIQFTYGIIQQVEGMASSIAMGAMVGGLGGAVVGAVTGLVSTGISYAQKQNEIDTKEAVEDISISQNLVRAGAGGSRRI